MNSVTANKITPACDERQMGRAAGLSGRLSTRGTERSQALEDRPHPSFGESAGQAIGGIGFLLLARLPHAQALADPILASQASGHSRTYRLRPSARGRDGEAFFSFPLIRSGVERTPGQKD
jgi:hypothetical protein